MMTPRNATVKILVGFVLWCALFAVTAQGRSLQRIHKQHHGGVRVKNLMELENEREMEVRLDDDADYDELPVHHSRRRHSRHRHSEEELDSSSEEDIRTLESLESRHPRLRKLPSYRRRSHPIKKRHNGASADVAYETMTDAEEELYFKSRARNLHHRSSLDTLKNRRYEVDLRQAQNTSLCNYTVVPIPDTSADNSRSPKDLVNVICNHAGSRCRSPGNYCCIQTYSKIDVSYSNGETEILKIYTGCVCSLRLYGELTPYMPKLPVDY